MFRWTESATPDQIQAVADALRALPAKIPEIRGFACGPDVGVNAGNWDFAVVAEMVRGRRIDERVSLDINPSSRQVLLNLVRDGHLGSLLEAGARLHQAGCNGCIGMG